MSTPCRLAESAGYVAGLECRVDATHPTQSIPMTEDEYWGSVSAFEQPYRCAACHGSMHAHWWGPAFEVDGQILYGQDLPPGSMYWASWHACSWDNCDGQHLHVVLPNGDHWDVDGRASNCTMRDDRTHRCWIRHGEPPLITVDKNGHTCSAGAGSILSGDYHGFLRNGVLT